MSVPAPALNRRMELQQGVEQRDNTQAMVEEGSQLTVARQVSQSVAANRVLLEIVD